MSLKNKELVDKNKYELTIEVERAVFNSAIDKVYRKSVKNITIPGFRRGKAPRAIIEKMYGKEVFYEDAVNEILPEAYEEAVRESELEIVSRPEFDIDEITDEKVIIKATVFVKPDVEIKDYKGIPVEKTASIVSDDEVNAELQKVQNRNSRSIEVTDRPAQDGDIANIDYEGFADGTAFQGGKGEGHDLRIGSGQFIPGFEEQIIGHNTGDSFDVNVTFPEEYHAKELAGKEAVFKCTLNAIKYNELPELDDEFAREVSEFDTLDEYKADLKSKLEENKAKAADAEVDQKISEAVIEKLEGDIPEAMYDVECENLVRDYDTRLRMQGLDLKTYFQYTGMNLDSLRQQMRPQAEKQVKLRLALEKIAVLENIEVSDEDIEEEYNKIAESYKMDIEKIKEQIGKDSIAADIKVKKAVDLIKENAVITEKAPEEEKAEEKPKKAKSSSSKAKDAENGEKTDDTKKTTAKKPAAKKTAAKKTSESSEAEINE